jgi:dTDP-4-amino-4,6-dideoxygalactose transaminase
VALARRHDLALVEDCAQAHGAHYRDRPVGTYGAVGAFSMQESKVLTCGEGGACVTDDAALAGLMEQYRADGRVYTENPSIGMPNLQERGDVQGRNMCLSEIQAAVLVGRLKRLDVENEQRRGTAAMLDEFVAETDGIEPFAPPAGCTRRTYYRYCARIDDGVGPIDVDAMHAELSSELGVTCEPLHDPLNECRLYNPLGSPEKYDPQLLARLDLRNYELPESRAARDRVISLPHFLLLGGYEDFCDIRDALVKVVTAHRI